MVTQKEIARRLNLTQATVSFCFNKPDLVAEKTRRRIIRLADRLGYRPNVAARAMSTGRFGCVSFLQDAVGKRSAMPSDLIDGILDALAERDFHLAMAKASADQLSDEEIPKIMRQMLSDGLLINFNINIPPHVEELVAASGLPAIWVNSKLEHDCICTDEFSAGRTLCEHLLSLGHRRIDYIDFHHEPSMPHYSKTDRYGGYCAAMQAAGYEPRLVSELSMPAAERGAAIRAWLSAADRPTAVMAYGEPHLRQPLMVAMMDLGLKVPGDLAVATFADGSCNVGIPTTSMLTTRYELGRTAVALLFRKIADPQTILPAARQVSVLEIQESTSGS